MSADKKKILVIEDNRMLAETYLDLLEHCGYEVMEIAATGETALKAAKGGRPDLLLMDISLEGSMDGIEASRRITDNMDVPIIFISGLSDDRTRVRMSRVKKHMFLMKPIDFKVLEQAIAELLDK